MAGFINCQKRLFCEVQICVRCLLNVNDGSTKIISAVGGDDGSACLPILAKTDLDLVAYLQKLFPIGLQQFGGWAPKSCTTLDEANHYTHKHTEAIESFRRLMQLIDPNKLFGIGGE